MRQREKIEKECAYCNKPIPNLNTYCNNTCQAFARRKKKLEENKISPRMLRTFLIKEHGPICMECGWSKENPFTKTIPIELEHIDGNSDNNTLENVKLLCPSCHSLTATYKGANMGKGRHKRRQRYAEGKSY